VLAWSVVMWWAGGEASEGVAGGGGKASQWPVGVMGGLREGWGVWVLM
jgi:hypothetical protein